MGAVLVADYTARQVSGVRRRTPGFTFTPTECGVPFEVVRFRTDDGIELCGWWLVQPHATRVLIGCTGHLGTKDELLGIGSGLWRAGNAVLLFDFRNRGESEVAPMSLAFREQDDLLAAVAYAKQRMGGAAPQIGVIGYSMGGAVALLAAARTPAIGAVVADSAFATMRGVLQAAYVRRHLPAQPFLLLADFITRRRYGYPFNAVRPLDVVDKISPRPLLLIHAAGDPIISVDDAQRLFTAAGEPKALWIAPAREHCGAYFADRSGYVERVASFFADTLPEHGTALTT
ncbi:MAG: alpha/beta hydrolase [Herpetosiphon sp.]